RGILACGGAAVRLVGHTPSLVRARADGPVAVIDIGHGRTDLVVVVGGKAVFSRSIARAGFHPVAALLVGGGSRLRGIASFLTEQLAILAWRLTADDAIAIAGPRMGAEAA